MTQAFLWADDCLVRGHFRIWRAQNRPDVDGSLAVAGIHAGPDIVRWLADIGAEAATILCRRRGLKQARYLANVVSGAEPERRLAVRVADVGAMPALTRAADALRLGVDPVATVAAFEASLSTVAAGVWLRSVAKLREPAPGFVQYLRSLVPLGPGFLVTLSPRSAVLPTGTRPPGDEGAGGALLVAAEGSDPVPRLLTDAFPGLQVVRVEPVTDAAGAYGAKGCEFLVDVPWTAVTTPTGDSCPVCGATLYTPSCIHCHVLPVKRGEVA